MCLITTIETPDGPFTAISTNGAVIASGWTADSTKVIARLHSSLRPTHCDEGDDARIRHAVEAYYSGDIDLAMRVPVVQRGTAMQMKGWEALRRIQPGEPASYSEFAQMLGSPRAVRAAASICARNAAALFVPCHRVIRSDQSLGGFAWGVEVKRSLLDREAAHCS